MKHLGFYFPNPIKIRNPNLMLTIIKFFKRGMDEIIEMIDTDDFIPYNRSFIEFLFFMRNHNHVHIKPDKTLKTPT